jgi:hypothetical protein
MRFWVRLLVTFSVASAAVVASWLYIEDVGHGQATAVAVAAIIAAIIAPLGATWAARAEEKTAARESRRSLPPTLKQHHKPSWPAFTLRPISGFAKQYRRHIISRVRFIDLTDFAIVGYFTPEIDEVYVDVSLTFRPPQRVSPALLGDQSPDPSERRDLRSFLNHKVPEVLAIVGPPGSGKTTLLRYTARQICLNPHRNRRRIPILLYLRDHVGRIIQQDAPAGLADLVRGTLESDALTEPTGWLEKNLRRGNCVVLLDGLDEVAQPEKRRVVSSWVERQIARYPNNDFIVTSRPLGYQTARIEGASVLQVRDFTARQVGDFVRCWYQTAAKHGSGAGDKNSLREAASAAEDLLRTLDDRPALRDLTVNPLLLTMMVNVHRDGGRKLPGSRAELYAEIIQVVVWRRQESKKIANPLPGAAREQLLQVLAYTMMRRRTRDISRTEILTVFNSVLGRWRDKITAEAFLQDASTNGLLVERESTKYSFVHQTLQEYLAAAYVEANGNARDLTGTVDDSWWRETTLLYAARGDDISPILRACLTSGKVNALALAFHCADQGSKIDTDVQSQIDEIIEDASRPGADSERRRLVAGVLLARQLRDQIHVGNGGYVCSRRISTLIYRLFFDNVPKLITDVSVASADDDGTAFGMMANEASMFIEWANDVIGGSRAYRLPTGKEAGEIADLMVRKAIASEGVTDCTWTRTGQSRPKLWVPSEVRHPYAISYNELRTQVMDDFANLDAVVRRLVLIQTRIAMRFLMKDLDEVRRLLIKRRGTDDVVWRHIYGVRYRNSSIALLSATGLRSDLVSQLDEDLADGLAGRDSPLYGARIDPVGVRSRFLAQALSGCRKLSISVQEELDRSTGHNGDVNYALGLDVYRGGGMLAKALMNSLPCDHDSLPQVFASNFFEISAGRMHDVVVSFEKLRTDLAVVTDEFRAALPVKASDKPTLSVWALTVFRRFQEQTAAVISREQRITQLTAPAARLAALTLAAELQRRADLLHLAAGVTILEWRATGYRATPETLMLATD